MKILNGMLEGGGMGAGITPTIVRIPGMRRGMGGIGDGINCGNPYCPDRRGAMGGGMHPGVIGMRGGGGGMADMGGAQCPCGDKTCPIARQIGIAGCPCEDCQRQMDGMGGGGGGGMMPPIMGSTSCGDPNCPDCGGGGMGFGGDGMPPAITWPRGGGEGEVMPAGGMQPGGQAGPPIGSDVTMMPKLRCLGMTGQEVDCTIDTGMQSNGQVTPYAYRKHFAGAPIDTSVPYSIAGVGATVANMLGRFLMVLTLDLGGEQVQVQGNIWIYPNENVSCELLVGINFLKANKIKMRFEGGGDTIEVQGRKFPLDIIANRFYRQWPTDEPAYEGSGEKMYKLGGSDIVAQDGYIMDMTEKGAHTYIAYQHHIAAAYRMHGHDVRHKHIEQGHVSDIEDNDKALQEAQKLSRESATLNKDKTVASTKSDEDLQKTLVLSLDEMKHKKYKPLQRHLISASSSSLADLQRQHNLSVEDMARVISRRAAESSNASSSKGQVPEHCEHYHDDTVDDALDRAIALSLQEMD